MNTLVITIGAIGIAVLLLGTFTIQNRNAVPIVSPTPTASSQTPEPTATTSPTPLLNIPTIPPAIPSPEIKQVAPTPTATPAPQRQSGPTSFDIRPIFLPTRVAGNEQFTIRWTVDGPVGAALQEVSSEAVYTQNGNGTNVNSRSQQSVGSSVVGQEHAATFSFGSGPGELTVTLRASTSDGELTSVHRIVVE
ncbi:MAG: hypothetical protein WD200_03290 [Candidatus Andersenbacteria bacterium]